MVLLVIQVQYWVQALNNTSWQGSFHPGRDVMSKARGMPWWRQPWWAPFSRHKAVSATCPWRALRMRRQESLNLKLSPSFVSFSLLLALNRLYASVSDLEGLTCSVCLMGRGQGEKVPTSHPLPVVQWAVVMQRSREVVVTSCSQAGEPAGQGRRQSSVEPGVVNSGMEHSLCCSHMQGEGGRLLV